MQRASEPTGAQRETDEALPWDLNADLLTTGSLPAKRNARRWTSSGTGFTLLAGPTDPHWLRFAAYMTPTAPLDVQVLDADTADALGLHRFDVPTEDGAGVGAELQHDRPTSHFGQ